MSRRPNSIIPFVFYLEDYIKFPRYQSWRKAPPAWLFQGVFDGILSHLPKNDADLLRKKIDLLFDALPYPFEVHPEERKQWTASRKAATVERIIRESRPQRGMPPSHIREVFLEEAIVVDDYLKQHPFPFGEQWKPKQDAWIKTHLWAVLTLLKKLPSQCGERCSGRTSLPSQCEMDKLWLFNRSPAKFLSMILAHYHRVKPATAIKHIQPPKARNSCTEIRDESLDDMSEEDLVMINRTNLAKHIFLLD